MNVFGYKNFQMKYNKRKESILLCVPKQTNELTYKQKYKQKQKHVFGEISGHILKCVLHIYDYMFWLPCRNFRQGSVFF